MNIANRDESWIHHYEQKTKRQFIEYRHSRSSSVRKFKPVLSVETYIQFLGVQRDDLFA